jgi:hypothetical protein
MSHNLDLYDTLKHGYEYARNPHHMAKYASEKGYKIDGDLSNRDHQILYNDEQKKMVHVITGTRNDLGIKKAAYDWANNAMIATNHTRASPRFNDEYNIHKKARDKYSDLKHDHIVGHSQGGGHTSELLKDFRDATGTTLNRATPTIGYTTDSKNLNKYRVALDPVSMRDLGLKSNKRTIFENPIHSMLHQHSLEPIKNERILIH